jgi:hypothetical protein
LSTANPGTLAYTTGTILGTGSITRWFKTGVIAAGSMTGLFPTGTSTDYRPFSVSAPAAGPTTGGTMTLAYSDATTNTIVSFPDGASTVAVRKDLNWALSTGNGLAGGTYNLGVAGTGFGQIGSVSDLRLTLVGSVVGTAGVNAGTTTNPQINRTGLSLANLTNTFYPASINPGMTPLPVTLISFTATAAKTDVVLNWSTAQEMNVNYFTIQRSGNGSSWEDIQQVAATGAGNSEAVYTEYDTAPLTGNAYYRLMMTDKDGGISYSAIAGVSFNIAVSSLSIYPNPASSYLQINFSNTENYTVSLINSLGQPVANGVSANASQLVLDVSRLKAGIYFVHIARDGFSETKEIVIMR